MKRKYKPDPQEIKLIIIAIEDKLKDIDVLLNQNKIGQREMTESQVAFWVNMRSKFNDLLEKVNVYYNNAQ